MPFYSSKPIGGLKVIYEYANHLAARGHQVTVVHPRELDKIGTRGIRHQAVAGLHSCLVRFRRMATEKKHHEPTATPEMKWFPVDSRVKMLYVPTPAASNVPDGDAVFNNRWVVGEYPPEKGIEFHIFQGYGVWPKLQAQEDALFRAPIGKIVIARWVYEQGLKLGASPDEMIYIPNGIDHQICRIIELIERRGKRIVMLYHEQPIKGAKDGIKALELARSKVPTLEAVLFGVFKRPKWLPGWIEYHHDPPQETLVGSIYNGGSIYLCPSWLEGFHLPPAEAMACGCAVVSTDIGGVRDYAEHGVTALLSPPRNPKALAENLLCLLKDDALRIELAKAGHERIQQFTWERSTDLMEQFITERVGQKNVLREG